MKITADVLKQYKKNSLYIDALQESIQRVQKDCYLYDEPEKYSHAERLNTEKKLIRKWQNQIEKLKAENADINTWVSRITDPVIQKAIKLHYFQGYTWQDTTIKLTNGYTERRTLEKEVQTFIKRNAS